METQNEELKYVLSLTTSTSPSPAPSTMPNSSPSPTPSATPRSAAPSQASSTRATPSVTPSAAINQMLLDESKWRADGEDSLGDGVRTSSTSPTAAPSGGAKLEPKWGADLSKRASERMHLDLLQLESRSMTAKASTSSTTSITPSVTPCPSPVVTCGLATKTGFKNLGSKEAFERKPYHDGMSQIAAHAAHRRDVVDAFPEAAIIAANAAAHTANAGTSQITAHAAHRRDDVDAFPKAASSAAEASHTANAGTIIYGVFSNACFQEAPIGNQARRIWLWNRPLGACVSQGFDCLHCSEEAYLGLRRETPSSCQHFIGTRSNPPVSYPAGKQHHTRSGATVERKIAEMAIREEDLAVDRCESHILRCHLKTTNTTVEHWRVHFVEWGNHLVVDYLIQASSTVPRNAVLSTLPTTELRTDPPRSAPSTALSTAPTAPLTAPPSTALRTALTTAPSTAPTAPLSTAPSTASSTVPSTVPTTRCGQRRRQQHPFWSLQEGSSTDISSEEANSHHQHRITNSALKSLLLIRPRMRDEVISLPRLLVPVQEWRLPVSFGKLATACRRYEGLACPRGSVPFWNCNNVSACNDAHGLSQSVSQSRRKLVRWYLRVLEITVQEARLPQHVQPTHYSSITLAGSCQELHSSTNEFIQRNPKTICECQRPRALHSLVLPRGSVTNA
jgi:hypothetical protein